MHTKRIAICIAACAVTGLALPTMASASPVLTSPTGTVAKVGTKFKSTTVGSTLFTTAVGTFQCTSGLNTGTLIKNNGTEIEGEVESLELSGTGAGGECTGGMLGNFKVTTKVTNGLPYCMRSLSNDQLELRGGSCAGASRPIVFTVDFAAGFNCSYERAAITATFTTEPGDATASAAGAKLTKISGSVVCPSEILLDTTLTLEKVNELAEPAYIS